MATTVHLSDVCTLATDRITPFESSERILRYGPYPYYADNCVATCIEDWEFDEGGVIMVPALGTVLASDGRLMAYYEPGRCSASNQVLPLVPRDPRDGRYIWRVLTTLKTPAACVGGTPQLREVAPSSLMHTAIPWPDARIRDRYVQVLDACEERIQQLADAIPQLLKEGDETFGRLVAAASPQAVAIGQAARWQVGSDVPIALRGAEKPVPVEGATGSMGRCDDALCAGPCIVLGVAARKALAHYCASPCHPIAETVFTEAGSSSVPLPALFFAMRAAGIPDRVRMAGMDVASSARTLEQALELPVQVGGEREWEGFLPIAQALFEGIQTASSEREQAITDRMSLILQFEKTGELDEIIAGKYCTSGVSTRKGDLAGDKTPNNAFAHADIPDNNVGPLAVLVMDSLAVTDNPSAENLWELAPLVALRANLNPDLWDALTTMSRTTLEANGPSSLPRFVNTALANVADQSELLGFLAGFSYDESTLGDRGIARAILALDGLDRTALDGRAMRELFNFGKVSPLGTKQERSLVGAVVSACSRSLSARGLVAMAYIPSDPRGWMADAASECDPGLTLAIQTPDIMDTLASALVRDRLATRVDQKAGRFAYTEGDALTNDAFPGLKAALALADLPVNAKDWSPAALSKADPRWALGVPPRNKANYAWLQHCLSHLVPGGLAVALATNAPLHSSVGCERELRQALARSGRLRMAVSLPARMEGTGTAARTLLVIGDAQPADAWHCLMVDLLDQGIPTDKPGTRALHDDILKKTKHLCATWIEDGTVESVKVPHALVTLADVEAHGCMLTPWTYTCE